LSAQVSANEAGDAGKEVKRLSVPQPRAKVVGRIELSTETIRDAGARSAPASERNLGRTDPNLRRQMMDRLRTRSGQRSDRRGGPGRQGAGFRGTGPRRGGPGQRRGGGTAVPLDPDKIVQIEPPVSVKRLSEALGIKVNQLLGILMKLGVMGVNINSFLDSDQVELVAIQCERKIELVSTSETEAELLEKIGGGTGAEGEESPRAPVVTFMGHVDHGKTSLLDALRKHDMAEGEQAITAGEAGGITQHIGAYKVTGRDGKQIVVLDTPGHAAFTSMRAHGANLTDVVVLVVAADDGVMPQTEEAINHAKAAEVPIVVAINKCDRPGANPMRTRQQLATLGLQPEEWGGSTQMVECSAITGQGLDELIEKIDLEALVLELASDPDQPARGTVIEAKMTAGQGNVISLLVMDGTLRKGDYVLCGTGAGRVRNMIDDHGRMVDEVGPATPVEVLGLPELPHPGDKFYVVTDSKVAKEIADTRSQKARELNLAERQSFTLETMSARLASKDVKEIRTILKADVMGSLEPIRRSLTELSTDEVKVTILHSGLGGITIADIDLADASRAVIIGFNSVPDETARQAGDRQGVQIRFYDVIYQLIDDIKQAMEGLLSPEEKEVVLGHAEIRAIFKVSRLGNIAGCYVTDGTVTRNGKYRLVRDGRVVHSGRAASLRRVKDDVREVRSGFECGIRLENFDDVKLGDVLECFEIQLEKRVLG
jgi:translation initiation factor IF-2